MTVRRGTTLVLSLLLATVGVALVVRTAQLGGGAAGYTLGGVFLVAGLGRLYLSIR